jgi:DNA-binding response OmpR family regulator
MDVPKLLLVEDDISLREILVEVLVDRGFEVTDAKNGNQAIVELEGVGGIFSAIVTDIKLGPGPDGWAVGRRARELLSDIPVIYITGDSAHDWSSLGVPESAVLAKPFAPSQLCTAILILITAADTNRTG